MELNGASAIITGASGGLGSEIALSLAAKGLHCLCHYNSNSEKAGEVVQTILAGGSKALAVQADLADAASAPLLFNKACELGPVRVLINSASIFQRNKIGTFSAEDVSKLMEVNLTAPLRLCNEFARYLQASGNNWTESENAFAAIVNMVDVAGVKPWAEYSPYCTSRTGLIGMTKSLAKEFAPGITVNAIAPGIVTWPGKMDPSEEQKQLKMIPAGRFGEPKDITRTIDFLLENDYITGQTVSIDGGRSL